MFRKISTFIIALTCLCSTSVSFAVLTCTIQSLPGLSFGPYVSTAASNATSNLKVNCTGSGTINFDISMLPVTTATSCNPRSMMNGANALHYTIYQDAAHTSVWGQDPTCGTAKWISSIGVGVTTIPIYGQIPAGQNALPAGTYNDTVTVSINLS